MDPQAIPLRGLHLPETVGWWPLAPGWWLLIVVLIAAAVFLIRAWLQRRAHAAARRTALRQLEESRSAFAYHGNPVTLGAETPSACQPSSSGETSQPRRSRSGGRTSSPISEKTGTPKRMSSRCSTIS